MFQIVFGLIGWSLLASLPYNEEIFVKGETLTFHITLALLISVWLVTVIIYILGISHSDKKDSMLPLNGPGPESYIKICRYHKGLMDPIVDPSFRLDYSKYSMLCVDGNKWHPFVEKCEQI